MVLAVKGLNYREIEISPGLGQVAIFRLSGQRQLPVLVNGEDIISDSSAIIKYLEKLHPKPKLIPEDPREEALVHVIEDWADTSMAKAARIVLLKSAATNPDLRDALLVNNIPDEFRKLINNLPCDFIGDLSTFINPNEEANLLSNLEKLNKALKINQWLVGNNMSIADIAFAAQLSLLRFPKSAGSLLAGKGCTGFSDNQQLIDLFEWRDRLEALLMESDPDLK